MTGRELVKASLAFENYERIPVDFYHSESPAEISMMSDFTRPAPNATQTDFVSRSTDELQHLAPDFRGELRENEWGMVIGRVEGDSLTQGESVWSPLREWGMLDSWVPPDFSAPERFENARRVFSLPENAEKYKSLFLGCFLYTRLRNLRGLVEASCDIALEKEMIKKFNTRLMQYYLNHIRNAAASGAEAVFFSEDLGTQQALLMSPQDWRELYKDNWGAVCDEARSLGMDVFIHSCGRIDQIIPDFIDVGVAALNLDQQQMFGLDFLAEHFGGKITFFNPVDIQTTMPAGDLSRIRKEASDMVGFHRRFNGGMIFKDYFGWNAISVQDKFAEAARDEVRKSFAAG